MGKTFSTIVKQKNISIDVFCRCGVGFNSKLNKIKCPNCKRNYNIDIQSIKITEVEKKM